MGSNPHYGFTSRSAPCKMRLKMISTAHAGSALPSVHHPSLFQSYHCEKALSVCPFRMHKVYSGLFNFRHKAGVKSCG